MNAKTYHVSGNSTVYTYGWMYKNAKISLKNAQENKEGKFFNVMNCIVYSAFAVEAYFNHLGSKKYDDWDAKERKLSKKKKLNYLAKELGIDIDSDKRPFRSILEAFRYRDSLAHGRTENITKSMLVEFVDEDDLAFMIKSGWFEFTELENAERIFDDMVKLITEFHQAASLEVSPFVSLFSESYSKSEVK